MKNEELHNLKTCCAGCGRQFKVRSPSEIGKRKFCSKSCQHEGGKKEKVKVSCRVCGKEIEVAPCMASKKYCTRECKLIGCRKTDKDGNRMCTKCLVLRPPSDYYGRGSSRCKFCEKARAKADGRSVAGRFRFSKHLAARRGLEWTITQDVYGDLLACPCHYCCGELDPTGIGLDRVDNGKGYLQNNVVPCCYRCNMVKGDTFTYEEMMTFMAHAIRAVESFRLDHSKMRIRILEDQGHEVIVKDSIDF